MGSAKFLFDCMQGPVPTPCVDTHYTASLFNQPERRGFRHAATSHEILLFAPQLIRSGLDQYDIPRFDGISNFYKSVLYIINGNTGSLRFVPKVKDNTIMKKPVKRHFIDCLSSLIFR